MLDDFLVFVEVARRSSFAQTAAEIKISAPTLSKRIQVLEEKLGQTLFVRSARGVVLTHFGQQLFDKFGPSILTFNQQLQSYQHRHALALSLLCPQNIIVGPLYSAVEDFQIKHPEVELNIESSNANVLLSQKRFDLAIRVGEQKDSGFYQKRLGAIAVCLIRRADCIDKNRLFMPYKKEQLGAHEFTPSNIGYKRESFVNDITLARKLTESGLGVGLLPMSEIAQLRADKTFVYDAEPVFTRPIYGMWANKAKPSSLVQSLLTILQEKISHMPELNGEVLPQKG